MVLGKQNSHMQNNKTAPLFYTTHKINSKWIRDIYIRPKIMKLQEENKEVSTLILVLAMTFY